MCIPHFEAWSLRYVESGDREDAPLVVLASGRVVAAGPEAREAGIEKGMTKRRVEAVCSAATMQPREPALEAAVWERVVERLNETTPYVEPVEPGRAFVRPVREEALREVVSRLGARAGRAPERSVAWLAALKALPGELLQIAPEHVEAFLKRLPVEHLTGTGFDARHAEHLALFGYDTVAAVRTLTKRHLTAQFGEAGARLHAFLQDDDASVPAYVPPPSIERSRRFEHEQLEPGPLRAALDECLEEAAEVLEGRVAGRMTLRLVGRTGPAREAARLLREPRGTAESLRGLARTLLDDMLGTEVPTMELEVELAALASPDTRQAHLFAERPHVRRAIEAVQRRFPGALQRAVTNAAAILDEDQVRFEPVL
jgi:nucleotidyltransferase/DNA polymerase involved in DNA repair